ncbi:MAG: LacI family DNA-binding transcriptional regulator [Armatimonadota bacterium]|nr:LacI family DNA-binding transcriptional regulator [Armatimonadota bacterium]
MRGKPTLRDVAERAGCSITTASNILQGRSHLYREDMAQRVLSAAHELGYRPNSVARSLARRRTATIGVVLDPNHARLTQNVYAHDVLDGILSYLEPRDYDIRLITPRTYDAAAVWRRIDNGSIDGAILIAPVMGSPLLEWHRYSSLPVVAVGSTLPDEYHHLPQVDIDNEAAMASLVEWVIQQGHRAIGFIKGHPLHWSAHQREQAFRRVMGQYGVPIREEWVLQGDYGPESGAIAAMQLLNQRELPTVVIASNDDMAIGFVQKCRELKIPVPDAISVAGFDDVYWAQRIGLQLTTIHHDRYQVGYLAAQLLLHRIETGSDAPSPRILIPGMLVVRRSVALAPALASVPERHLSTLTDGGIQR